jgi:hypothetical protein
MWSIALPEVYVGCECLFCAKLVGPGTTRWHANYSTTIFPTVDQAQEIERGCLMLYCVPGKSSPCPKVWKSAGKNKSSRFISVGGVTAISFTGLVCNMSWLHDQWPDSLRHPSKTQSVGKRDANIQIRWNYSRARYSKLCCAALARKRLSGGLISVKRS